MGPRTRGLQDKGWVIPKAAYNGSSDVGLARKETAVVYDSHLQEKGFLPAPPLSDPKYDGDYAVLAADGFTPREDSLNLSYYLPLGMKPYSIKEELNSPEMLWIAEVDMLYLSPGLSQVADLFTHSTTESVASLKEFLVLFAAAYLSCYVLFMILFFLPQVNRVNMDIISKRHILLFVPLEIAAHPPIKALIKSILSADAERHGYGYASAGGSDDSSGQSHSHGNTGGLKPLNNVTEASSGMATLNGTPHRAGLSGGAIGGSAGDADLSAAARMTDGNLPLSRTRSFHEQNGGYVPPSSTRLTAADI
jgi:hypothetical protein